MSFLLVIYGYVSCHYIDGCEVRGRKVIIHVQLRLHSKFPGLGIINQDFDSDSGG